MRKVGWVGLCAAAALPFLFIVARAQEEIALAPDDAVSSIAVEGDSERVLEVGRADVLAQTARLRESREAKDLLAKAGQWSSRRFNTDARSWQVQLERDRNTDRITGSIRANGSYLLTGTAKVDGQLTGSSVSGVVTDAAGKQLATFTGVASAKGMSGTYVTADGDDGEWSYDDPEAGPQAVSETSELGAELVE